MRLNRFLAFAGFGSRRACEKLILEGKVSINGHFIRELATTVQPDDDVRVIGKPARANVPVYLLLNKPRGILSTASDEHGRQTVLDVVPPHFGRLFHVGRLDKDSEGLILLTNDGALSQKLTHPGHEVEKEYEVLIDKPLDPADAAKLMKGFMTEEGRARMEKVHTIDKLVIKVVLRQGLKRQIRIMLYKLGYEVKRLVRVRIGPIEIERMRPGQWRLLNAKEVASLQGASKPKKKPTPRPKAS